MRRLLLVLSVLVWACAPTPVTPEAKSQLRAATSGDYPPLSSWTGAQPEGFAPSLVGAFAAHEHVPVVWSRFRWPDLSSGITSDRFVLAADGITVRPERSIVGRFTIPIARGGAVLLLRRPSWAPPEARDLQALDRADLRIVVNAGGHLERVTRRLFHAATITAIPDNASVRNALARREADAAMTNTFEAPRWSAGLEGIDAIGPLTNDTTALFLRADESELEERIDAWLLDEEASGRLGALRAKTLGTTAPVAEPVSALVAATAERLALMPFVAAAKKVSGQTVEDTAQEERVLAAARASVAKAAAAHRVPAPPVVAIDTFFRAQIELAKTVQDRAPTPLDAKYSLAEQLRPAIARISARMAFLVVRLPRDVNREALVARARMDLADLEIDAARIDLLADAIVALSR